MKKQPRTLIEILVIVSIICIFFALITPPLARYVKRAEEKTTVTTPPGINWDKVRSIHVFSSADHLNRAGLVIFVEQDAGEGNIDILRLKGCRRIPSEIPITWYSSSSVGE